MAQAFQVKFRQNRLTGSEIKMGQVHTRTSC
jgi:hypothetical protein